MVEVEVEVFPRSTMLLEMSRIKMPGMPGTCVGRCGLEGMPRLGAVVSPLPALDRHTFTYFVDPKGAATTLPCFPIPTLLCDFTKVK